MNFRDLKITLTTEQVLSDLNESPGVTAEAATTEIDPLDMLWLNQGGMTC